MKVSAAEFETSAVHPADYPPGPEPEVAFAGRSNVGKSSMMNALLGRRGLVKTSSTPGKTQTLNFFRVRAGKRRFRFVDLPGYGYAKVPERVRQNWGKMIEAYLEGRAQLRGVVVILDIRRGVMEMDRQLVEWLAAKGIETLVVLTKADKLSRPKGAAAAARAR
ncbi:MAG: ribosome biogenesis GTP-binding protein YihA/YsxC, partial [Nitrospinota bacterium]